jgi:hypothetical protein
MIIIDTELTPEQEKTFARTVLGDCVADYTKDDYSITVYTNVYCVEGKEFYKDAVLK